MSAPGKATSRLGGAMLHAGSKPPFPERAKGYTDRIAANPPQASGRTHRQKVNDFLAIRVLQSEVEQPAHERTITGEMTVFESDRPHANDPLASQRAMLLGQLVAAQFDLESAIADLTRNGASTVLADAQLQYLTGIQRQIGSASPATLSTLRGDIAAAVTLTQSVIQQSRAAVGTADGADIATLASRAQGQAASFMRDRHQYDDLLQFDSEAERDAYRDREEERRKRYEAESAKGTPEGALNASGAALGQMADLAVHGGNADPVLMRRMDDLAASTAALRERIIRDGGDVSIFDNAMRADLRDIMRSKGKSEAEIDALLAAHRDNPIEAVKAFVREQKGEISEKEIADLSRKAREHKDSVEIAPARLASPSLPC